GVTVEGDPYLTVWNLPQCLRRLLHYSSCTIPAVDYTLCILGVGREKKIYVKCVEIVDDRLAARKRVSRYGQTAFTNISQNANSCLRTIARHNDHFDQRRIAFLLVLVQVQQRPN